VRWLALVVLTLCGCGAAPCPDGQVRREVCTACGPTDACVGTAQACVPACSTGADCQTPGVCENGGCLPLVCG